MVLLLLFGAKRLPDAARSLGRSMRIFKSEVKEMRRRRRAGRPQRVPTPREVEGRVVEPHVGRVPRARPGAERRDR